MDCHGLVMEYGIPIITGSWALQHAPELQWSDGDRWHVSVDLPANGVYEYKYVIMSSEGQHAISWQRGNNCVLAIKPDDDRVEVYDNWYGGDVDARGCGADGVY